MITIHSVWLIDVEGGTDSIDLPDHEDIAPSTEVFTNIITMLLP